MKNQLKHQKIETIENIQGEFTHRMIPQGTLGIILESYQNPESYAIDLALPDNTLPSGFAYENVVLFSHQFKVVGAVTRDFSLLET
ncbi:MAG: hypothetical protein WA902_01325 [Thermosynechococcaceae cyanobacterium]